MFWMLGWLGLQLVAGLFDCRASPFTQAPGVSWASTRLEMRSERVSEGVWLRCRVSPDCYGPVCVGAGEAEGQ